MQGSVLDGFHRTRNVANLIWSGLASRLTPRTAALIEVSPTLHFAFESCFDTIVPYVSSNIDFTIIYLATGAHQINGTVKTLQ